MIKIKFVEHMHKGNRKKKKKWRMKSKIRILNFRACLVHVFVFYFGLVTFFSNEVGTLIQIMRTSVGVWPRVMKRENMGLCNGREQKRGAEKRVWRRERKWGENERGPSNGNKTGTHINSVRIWIQLRFKNKLLGVLKFVMRPT